MPELSQDAIRELRQSLPLLKRLIEEFAQAQSIYHDDIARLQGASDRVRALTPTDQFEAWVGGSITFGFSEENEVFVLEIVSGETTGIITSSSPMELVNHLHRYAHSLYLYVQGILRNEELEERLNHLTQENASQKEQLAELRRRELTYLTMLGEAQTATAYSPPPDSNKILLASLERQRAIITKNLGTAQEQKAQYGLDPPLRLLNTIYQLQEDLKAVDNSLGYLKANITEMK